MSSINRIIVATDTSPVSAYAESRAAMLAHELGSKSLDLVHIVDTLSLKTLGQLVQAPEQAEHKLLDWSRQKMAEVEKRLKDQYQVSCTSTTLNVGRPYKEIVHYAKLLNAGLLVMGVHSGGGIRDLFVGSTVDKVLRTLTCPVLVVKREPRTPYQRVLAPIDFSESSRLGVDVALSVAPQAEITVLHAFEMPFQANFSFSEEQDEAYLTELEAEKRKELQNLVSEFEPERLSVAVAPGAASTVIREQIETLDSDLVVIGKHGKSGLEDLLLGSVTKQVLQYADCDVLVVG
jgi:nucleotide-binding universal stress UspA family protein